MQEYKFLVNCGIGDCIVYKSQFEKITKNNPDIIFYISPNENIISWLGNSAEKYKKFIHEFCHLIFDGTNVFVSDDQSFELANPTSIYYKFNVIPQFIDLSKYLVKKTTDVKSLVGCDDYICIHTKIKGCTEIVYNQLMPQFIDFLKKNTSCKIVLLGERDKIIINDQISLPQYTYNMYSDCIREFGDRIIDLTIPDYCKDSVPNLFDIFRDSDIIAKAKTNIIIGFAGNLHIASSAGYITAFIDREFTEKQFSWICSDNGFFSLYYEHDYDKYCTGYFGNFARHILDMINK